jgi:hypothetical protein
MTVRQKGEIKGPETEAVMMFLDSGVGRRRLRGHFERRRASCIRPVRFRKLSTRATLS